MTDLDIRRRAALYRANHRGMKEADVLVGGFATAHLADLDETELAAFEGLLEEQDAELMDWVYGHAPLPGRIDAGLFARLMAFKPYA